MTRADAKGKKHPAAEPHCHRRRRRLRRRWRWGGCSARQVAQARPRGRCLTGRSSTSAIQGPEVSTLGDDVGHKVEALLVKRQRDQSRPFVRWLGFDASHDTWEDEANRLDPSLVSNFRSC